MAVGVHIIRKRIEIGRGGKSRKNDRIGPEEAVLVIFEMNRIVIGIRQGNDCISCVIFELFGNVVATAVWREGINAIAVVGVCRNKCRIFVLCAVKPHVCGFYVRNVDPIAVENAVVIGKALAVVRASHSPVAGIAAIVDGFVAIRIAVRITDKRNEALIGNNRSGGKIAGFAV